MNAKLFSTIPGIEVGATDGYPAVMVFNTKNDANARGFYALKTRGTAPTSYTVVQSGDAIGMYVFLGADGTQYRTAAQIRVKVDGTPGTDDMPGRIEFLTSPDGSYTPVVRMTINSTGTLTVQEIFNTECDGTEVAVFVNSDGTLGYESSAADRKTDIVDAKTTETKDLLTALRPREYTKIISGKTETGLIAEEVAQVAPELAVYHYDRVVVEDKGTTRTEFVKTDKLKTVRYHRLITPLLVGHQEQAKEIEALKAQVAAQAAALKALEARVAKLENPMVKN
jgi:hypothetical protein